MKNLILCFPYYSTGEELMAEDCIFCKIVSGEIPSQKVFEDENTFAFLDINPSSKGHSLVITKKHYETLVDVPEDELKQLIISVKKVSQAVIKATNSKGFNILQNNNKVAGQIVNHIHFHIIPRSESDSINFSLGSKQAEANELEKVAELIRKEL